MPAENPDDDDPFPATQALGAALVEPIPLDAQAALRRCWDLFMAHPGLCIAVAVLPTLVSWSFDGLDFGIELALERFGDDTSFALVLVLGQLVAIFADMALAALFYAGTARVYLELARNRPASLDQLVGEVRRVPALLAAIVLYIAAALAIVAPSLIAGIGVDQGWWVETWASIVAIVNVIVAIGPWMMLSVVVPFVPYVIVDRGIGPVAALRDAWELTDGHKMTIFGITIVAWFALGFVTAFTCGLGYLAALPAYALLQAVLYDSLRRLALLTSTPSP